MKALICSQVEKFLRESGVTAAELSKASGVHFVDISRLKRGVVRDTSSRKADALRAAMVKLDPETALKVL